MTKFPDSWWRDRPLVIAHRGASHVAPQNTLAAFRKAVELGADGIELDVHLSADGVPVVIHDAILESTTDGAGKVRDKTLSQLKELDAGSSFDSRYAGECIPTLEEVLAEVGHEILINIELKDFSLKGCGLEETVVALLYHMGMLERVWFSSFNPMSLHRVRNYTQTVPCGLLYAENLSIALLDKKLTSPASYEALHPHHTLVTAKMIQKHKYPKGQTAGDPSKFRVATWTVDAPDRARELAALGVDAIITNKPAEILEALL